MRQFREFFSAVMHPGNHPIRREKWTRDILHLVLVLEISVVPILALLSLLKALDYRKALVIVLLIIVTLPFWYLSRTRNWHWARYFPPALCFGLGIYSSLGYLGPVSTLFYALGVFLAGMLLDKIFQRILVILSTLAYAYTTLIIHPTSTVNDLGIILTSFFLLIGIAAVQEYYHAQVDQLFNRQNEINSALSEEINRRETAEVSLVESESQLRRLAEYSTDMVAEISPEGIFRYASPSYKNNLGYDPQDLLNKNALDIVHPDDIQYIMSAIEEASRDKTAHIIHMRCLHANGSEIYVETSGVPLVAPDGNIDGFIISSRDVTHLQIAEARRIETEQLQQNVIAFIPLGIHMYSLRSDGELIFNGYNPAADKILHIDHSTLLGKSMENAFPNLAVTEIPERYRDTARFGIPWAHDQVVYTDEKIIGTYDVHAFRSTPMNIIVMFSDITEKFETARALRASEEKFSKAFHTSPDAVNINRLADGLYIDINQGFTNLTGFERADVVGKTSMEINIWADPLDRERLVSSLREKGFVDNLQAGFRFKDGIIKTGLMSARVIEINNEKCILSITRDISHRIEAENKLKIAHEDLEQAYTDTLLGWVHALELREHETADHSRRVVDLTLQMLDFYNFNEEQRKNIYHGALLHDIGKIGVPDNILLKPGQLDDHEWVVMRNHPKYAREMIEEIPYLTPSMDIPYYHHERWDGKGYPEGISGRDIPLPARIFAVIDVYDALLSDRPYRKAWKKTDAVQYLVDQKGLHFDPDIVDNFLKLLDSIQRD